MASLFLKNLCAADIPLKGELLNVPLAAMIVDTSALQGGIRQRSCHVNGVVRKSIAKHGFVFNTAPMRVIEKAWKEEEWAGFLETGGAPVGTPMPAPLRELRDWEDGRLKGVDYTYRRLCVADGNNRTDACFWLRDTNHENAITHFKTGVHLQDCSYDEVDRNKALIDSIKKNVTAHAVDRDFILDKFRQLKAVNSFIFKHHSCVLTPSYLPPHSSTPCIARRKT
jgi:hypothetical protein